MGVSQTKHSVKYKFLQPCYYEVLTVLLSKTQIIGGIFWEKPHSHKDGTMEP